MFRPLLLLSLLLVPAGALAQDLSAEQLLENLHTSAESLQDASFTLRGSLTDVDGSVLPLEIYVQAIPDLRAARADIVQPDALADNAIVLAGDTVYNYIFLTNQVTLFATDDPDALGGLFPEGNVDQGFDMTFNPEQLFRGWTSSVQGYGESPLGNVYEMRFVNEEPGALVSYVDASILDGSWVPYTLEFYDEAGQELVSLIIEDFQRDLGLEVDEVTYIPEDAEVIDER